MEIVECGYAHFIEDGSRSHWDIVFEEAQNDVTSSATPIDVSIFSAPLNTGIDQNQIKYLMLIRICMLFPQLLQQRGDL